MQRDSLQRDRVVPVALVVAPRGVAMVLPRPAAHPAEVVAAGLARHVVAPLVLLDGGAALWALLGVGQDPGRVLAFAHQLLLPQRQLCFVSRGREREREGSVKGV